jgi:hypothetical protein
MLMIRTVCLAVLATGTMLMAQGASATVNVNGRVSQIVNGLRANADFSQRAYSLTLQGGKSIRLFSGIEGLRKLAATDFKVLNDWAAAQPSSGDVFNGAPYKFTHSVLGSFFDHDEESGDESGDAGSEAAGPVLGGAPSYKFTHSVLGSYFSPMPSSAPPAIIGAAVLESPEPVIVAAPLMPVPEPASWAMMIGGFALTGAALRRRRMTASLA